MKALPKALHKAVLWVQTEAHGPQDLCVFLAQVVKGVHQLFQVGVGVHHVSCQNVVKTMCGMWETLLQLLTPDQLCDLDGYDLRYYVISSDLYFYEWKIYEYT